MQENPNNNSPAASRKPLHEKGRFSDQRTMNRWQYRADQVQLRQQQVQSEMSTSVGLCLSLIIH